MPEGAKYPEVTVALTGQNGNSMAIVAAVGRALRKAGVLEGEVDEFRKEALSGDYDHVLQTAMAWVEVT